jgi:hypothetical protein
LNPNYAILKSIERFINETFANKLFIIRIKSDSVIKVLYDPNSTTSLVQQIYKNVHYLKSWNLKVNISKIESDSVQERERLMRRLSTGAQNLISQSLMISYARKLVNEKIIKQWNQRWTQSIKGTATKKTTSTRDGQTKSWKEIYKRLLLDTNFYKLMDALTNI